RIAQSLFGCPYDVDGAGAGAGRLQEGAVADLAGRIVGQAREGAGARRSLGTGDELEEWIGAWRNKAEGSDLAATACAVIAHLLREFQGAAGLAEARLIVAGGGSRNVALMDAIRQAWMW